MSPFIAELLGTMVMILLGDGVVANVVLKKTKGFQAGWITITTAWGARRIYRSSDRRPLQRRPSESCHHDRFCHRREIPVGQRGALHHRPNARCRTGGFSGMDYLLRSF